MTTDDPVHRAAANGKTMCGLRGGTYRASPVDSAVTCQRCLRSMAASWPVEPTQDEVDAVARKLLASVEDSWTIRNATGQAPPLTQAQLEAVMDRLLAAEPWRVYLGKAELRVTDQLPVGDQVLVVSPPQGQDWLPMKIQVVMRPGMHEAILKAHRDAGMPEPPDDHLAAIIVWQLNRPRRIIQGRT